MHDPMVLALSIRRPFPRIKRRSKTRVQVTPFRFGSCFWYVGRFELYWPSVIDVWHDEPGGRDSGEVCGYPARGRKLPRWLFVHRSHLHVNIIPIRAWNRRLYQRCAHCKGKSRKGHEVNVSHQWDGPRQKWGQSAPGLYHMTCSGLVNVMRERDEAHRAIAAAGLDAADLELAGVGSTEAWRVIYRAHQTKT
jgi:hypothetical protein